MVIFVVQRKKRWGTRVNAIISTQEQVFEDFQRVNEAMEKIRDRVDITLQHIREDQIQDWIRNNVDPNWYEILMGRISYSLWERR
jgi:hypothetical protein